MISPTLAVGKEKVERIGIEPIKGGSQISPTSPEDAPYLFP